MSEFRQVDAEPLTGEDIMDKVMEQTQVFAAYSILKEMVGDAQDDLKTAVRNPEAGIDPTETAQLIGDLTLSLAFAERDFRKEVPRLLNEIRGMVMPSEAEAPMLEFRDLTGGGLDYYGELAEKRQDRARIIGQVANVGEYWWNVQTLDGQIERVFPSHPISGGKHIEITVLPSNDIESQELAA